MSARILVVDDVLANVTLLKAKLHAACYDVLTATSGPEALEIIDRERPDLVLLDVMMPEMDGFEVCRRLKTARELCSIPVVMVTALDQPSDRIRGLEAGADDFLTKPPNDLALFERVRSLVRYKLAIDELKLRNEAVEELGAQSGRADNLEVGRVVIGEPRPARAAAAAKLIAERFGAECEVAATPRDVLTAASRSAAATPDLFLVAGAFDAMTGAALCAELRARTSARHAAIIVALEHDDYAGVAQALDLGADDYVMRPIDEAELIARVRAQIARKRYADRLRADVDAGIRLATRDPLTGLYNRRYADAHMQRLLQRHAMEGAPCAALLFDLDRFKSINDSYGHAAGDKVLIDFSMRMSGIMRGVDLKARYGGEEFLAFLPGAEAEEAMRIAERVRASVADRRFAIPEGDPISVTVSVGVAVGFGAAGADQKPVVFDMLSRADEALYASKQAGRDRVTLGAAPAKPAAPETAALKA